MVIPDDVIFDPPRLLRSISSNCVTEWLSTPSLFESVLQLSRTKDLIDAFKTLRVLLFNGEVVRPELARRALQVVKSSENPKARLFNLYSISECHEVSMCEITAETVATLTESEAYPVGYTQPYARSYLINPNTLEPVEEGEVGMLHIGGPGLAVGYVGNEGLTQEKFPTVKGLGRLYNTGDLARMKKVRRMGGGGVLGE